MANLLSIALILIWCGSIWAWQQQQCSTTDVEDAFTAHDIPLSLDIVAPKDLVTLVFTSGYNLYLGNRILTYQGQNIQSVSWPCNPGTYYTFITVDPDVPSRANPVDGQFLYSLIVNVPCNNFTAGDPLFDFTVAIPRNSVGCHRNVVLIYEQSNNIRYRNRRPDRRSNNPLESRYRFSVANFAKEYGLGNPVAGNFVITPHNGTTCAIPIQQY